MAHKILFGACFVMFLIPAAHLALFVHQASSDFLPSPAVAKAMVILATFQVGRKYFVTGVQAY
jgi:hypothetical protein